jgi:hypothetical protein
MPFVPEQEIAPCTVCGSQANIYERDFKIGTVVNCSRCGDYQIGSRRIAEDANLPITDIDRLAVAAYLIRQMNGALIPASRGSIQRPTLTSEFFFSLHTRSLPSPAEASDNLLLYGAKAVGSRIGQRIGIRYYDEELAASVGVVGGADVEWLVNNLARHDYAEVTLATQSCGFRITGPGWDRIAELRQKEETSRYAFFARKFDNADLDAVFEQCLLPAVLSTGFELRTVTQRAGLVDAIIEDEIRRCAFLLADLSDDNPGAYWEAGFAEGLGKPVIYICKALDGTTEKRIHFDANHRHTIRWDLHHLEDASAKLTAVIRNTLLGRAKQSDR